MLRRWLTVLLLVTILNAQQASFIVQKPLPFKVIKVGAQHYDVHRASNIDFGRRGEADSDHLQILIAQNLPADIERETMIHEILHACMYTYIRWVRHTPEPGSWEGYHPDKTAYLEHNYIEAVSPCMLQVMRDNPDVVKYLVAE